MNIIKYNPMNEIRNMKKEMAGWPSLADFKMPDLDISMPNSRIPYPEIEMKETKDNIRMTVKAPGIPKDRIKVKVQGNSILVQGEFEKEEKGKHGKEKIYSFSSEHFMQQLPLPIGMDTRHMKTKTHNGTLTIEIPRKEIKLLKAA